MSQNCLEKTEPRIIWFTPNQWVELWLDYKLDTETFVTLRILYNKTAATRKTI